MGRDESCESLRAMLASAWDFVLNDRILYDFEALCSKRIFGGWGSENCVSAVNE